jgi:hypothetical protein
LESHVDLHSPLRAHKGSLRWRNWCVYNTSKFSQMEDTWWIVTYKLEWGGGMICSWT